MITLVSHRVQGFSQNQILDMINPSDLDKIKQSDEHPFFQVYSICHEGTHTPRLIGQTARPITWTRQAIQSIKNVVLKGVKIFKGHNADSSTDNRKPYGEIVAETQKEIDGKLHQLAITYHAPDVKEEAKKMDSVSHEGEWNFFEKAGQLVANTIEKMTGIAGFNSNEETPAFNGAVRLGMVQAYDNNDGVQPNNNSVGDTKTMTYEEIRKHLDFGMFKRAARDMNIHPWQIFEEEDLKNDRQFGKLFDEKQTLLTEKETLQKQLEESLNNNKVLEKQTQMIDATTRLGNIIKEKSLTEKQQKFVVDRFNDGIEDLSDEGLKKHVDSELESFKTMAKYYVDKELDLPEGNNSDNNPDDYNSPENNPLIFND